MSDSVLTREAESAPARSQSAYALALWAGNIFLSAFLLFEVQPILAKIILPWFGGGAGVWTASLVFFQFTYLLGNLYAWWLIQRSSRWQTRIHIALLAASLALLPILPGVSWKPAGAGDPVLRIFALLAATIGLPFLLLSATSPLLQAWYVRRHEGAWPYRFYALSNAGSLLALLSYPVLVEPHSATRHQAFGWSAAYAIFVLACAWISFRQPRGADPAASERDSRHPDWKLQLLWLALAADASALLLSVTTHISQNIAAVPLLWIIPLSLYLLSLILCFEGRRWYRRSWFLRFLVVALGGMAYALSPEFVNAGPLLHIPLFCIGLFICCMVCHGELAQLKPEPRHLTAFYLMISAGGALGGILAGVIAPRLFRGFYELPIALAGCAVLSFVSWGLHSSNFLSSVPRRSAFAITAGAIVLLIAFVPRMMTTQNGRTIMSARNFYGLLRAENVPATATQPPRRYLYNGTIVHGIENLPPGRRTDATSYFGPESGAAMAFADAHEKGAVHAGIIGLGAGTLASYGRPGDRFTFYEINPLVVRAAQSQFDFLRDSQAQIGIVLGDARISLERQPAQNFDLLLVDAFSGDAIPVHLLTREAFELYFRHLRPGGVLALHISNKFLNLRPVVQAVAHSLGAPTTTIISLADPNNAIYTSTWVLVDRSAPEPIAGDGSAPLQWKRVNTVVPPWTDDYSSLLKILEY